MTLPDPAEFERTLREKYEPILSPDDYARLRELCGLGAVIDGEIVVDLIIDEWNGLSEDDQRELMSYTWPGGARQTDEVGDAEDAMWSAARAMEPKLWRPR